MKKLTKAIAALAMAGFVGFAAADPMIALVKTSDVQAVDTNNDDWLHAEGSRLYDMNGNEVWLTGANWFGFNCGEACPHYLWSADIDDILQSVVDHGINVLRFPVSTELLLSWMNGTPKEVSSIQVNTDPSYTINPDFAESDGKTPKDSMEIFDIIMQKCKKYGVKAFIDVHSPHTDNSGHNYNLWYGKETEDGTMVTTEIWRDTLVWLADKYKNDDTLIGYDLKNEPHGKGQEGTEAAKWDGSTDENNWAYAATKCADAILEVNPNALIMIEGVEQSLSGAMPGDYWGIGDRRDNSPYIGAWWGGNFRGAREYPIKPEHGTSQIVYSPHDYGPSVYAQTWFDKDFTEQTLLDDYWYDTWAYINAEDIAPELIGEWGGHMDGTKNQKWMELLRDYMIKNHINHTFWCLNPNSGDTAGLLGYDFYEWDEVKYGMFEESLWQTQESGKFIGLDHQKPLGVNNTGISLNEFYDKYAASEGSNIDGGTKGSDPKPPVTTKAPSNTTAPEKQTTESSTTAASDTLYGDANCDGKVEIADATLILQFLTNKDEYSLSAQGLINADVIGNNDGVTGTDALTIQQVDAGIYKASDLPIKE